MIIILNLYLSSATNHSMFLFVTVKCYEQTPCSQSFRTSIRAVNCLLGCMKTSSFTGSVFPRPILLILYVRCLCRQGDLAKNTKLPLPPPPLPPSSSPTPAGIWLIYIVVPRYVRMYCLYQCTRLWNREKRKYRTKYKDVREGTKDVRQGGEKGTEEWVT
jgi:hypothetical protein